MISQPILLLGIGTFGEVVLTQLAVRLRQVAAADGEPSDNLVGYGAEAFARASMLSLGFAPDAAESSDPGITYFSLFSPPQDWLQYRPESNDIHPILKDWFDPETHDRERQKFAVKKKGAGYPSLEPYERQLARLIYLSSIHRRGTVLKSLLGQNMTRAAEQRPDGKTLQVGIIASLGDAEGSALVPDIGLIIRTLAEKDKAYLKCYISLYLCFPSTVGYYGLTEGNKVLESSFAALREIERFAVGGGILSSSGSNLSALETTSRLFDRVTCISDPPDRITNQRTGKAAYAMVVASLADTLLVELLPDSGASLAQVLDNREARLKQTFSPGIGLITMATDVAGAHLPLLHIQSEWAAHLMEITFAKWSTQTAKQPTSLYPEWVKGGSFEALQANSLPNTGMALPSAILILAQMGQEITSPDWLKMGNELRVAMVRKLPDDKNEERFTSAGLLQAMADARRFGVPVDRVRTDIYRALREYIGSLDPNAGREERGGIYGGQVAAGMGRTLDAARVSMSLYVQCILSEFPVTACLADMAAFDAVLQRSEIYLKQGADHIDSQLRSETSELDIAYDQFTRLSIAGRDTQEARRFREAVLDTVRLAKIDQTIRYAINLVIRLREEISKIQRVLAGWQTFFAGRDTSPIHSALTKLSAQSVDLSQGTLMTDAAWLKMKYNSQISPLESRLKRSLLWKVECLPDGQWSILLSLQGHTFDPAVSSPDRLGTLWFEAVWKLVVTETQDLSAWDYVFRDTTNLNTLEWLKSVLSQRLRMPSLTSSVVPLSTRVEHYLFWPRRNLLGEENWKHTEELKHQVETLLHSNVSEYSLSARTHVMRFTQIDHIPLRHLTGWERAYAAYKSRTETDVLWVYAAEAWADKLARLLPTIRNHIPKNFPSPLDWQAASISLLQDAERLRRFCLACAIGMIHLVQYDRDSSAWQLSVMDAQGQAVLAYWLSKPRVGSANHQGIDWLPEAARLFTADQMLQTETGEQLVPLSVDYTIVGEVLDNAIHERSKRYQTEALPEMFGNLSLLQRIQSRGRIDVVAPQLEESFLMKQFADRLWGRLAATGDESLALLALFAEYHQRELNGKIDQAVLKLT